VSYPLFVKAHAMSRTDHILKYAEIAGRGIEIAPYHQPLVRKSQGRDVLYMDIIDTAQARERASRDPFLTEDMRKDIAEIDIVGNAIDIAELCDARGISGSLNYIVSSHNFEHLPDPIKFLQGCHRILAPGGVLSMALPDCRATFDHFRFPTRLCDWLEAYFEHRRQPTQAQIFDQETLRADYFSNQTSAAQPGCSLDADSPTHFRLHRKLNERFNAWIAAKKNGDPDYEDVHCSVLFNASFELMIRDLTHLGLLNFEIVEISATNYHEFYAHLQKLAPETREMRDEIFYEVRSDLLKTINQELGWWAFAHWRKQNSSEEEISCSDNPSSLAALQRKIKHQYEAMANRLDALEAAAAPPRRRKLKRVLDQLIFRRAP
jgi:SAM-dependent methyltransferase